MGDDKRKRIDRRKYSREKPQYPFKDSDGALVAKNRRRIVDRRLSQELMQEIEGIAAGVSSRVIVFQCEDKTVRRESSRGSISIGRTKASDLTIDKHYVSRNHAYVKFNEPYFVLVDNSRNGTFVRFKDTSEIIQVHNDKLALKNSGIMAFGHGQDENNVHILKFHIEAAPKT